MIIEGMKFKDWKPKIICLCGSTRFMDAFRSENLRLTLEGNIILTVGCDTKSDEELKISAEKKTELDQLHLKKIEMADEVRIINVGGYVGSSTAREYAYSRWIGKSLSFMLLIPTIGDFYVPTTTGRMREEMPRTGMTPWLEPDSVQRMMDACKAIKNDPVACYHFKS